MSRKIKFRFYSNPDKKMYQLSMMDAHTDFRTDPCVYEGSYVPSPLLPSGRVQKFSDGHIMQYIGIKDKNEKEIYEKDVILFGDNIDTVVFDEGCFYAEKSGYLIADIKDCEVIGNIYENPELLESA